MRVLPSPRTVLLPFVATVAALVLAGCVEAAPDPDPTQPAPSPTVSQSPTVLPTDTATEEQGSLDISCLDLVDADAVYAFDPNFALVGTFDPDAGSAGAQALEWEGVVCRWVRETGDITMDLSAARVTEAQSTQLRNEAFASSQMVPTYGEEAYFDAATGTATVFQGPYWLVLSSPAFAEPGEATGIVESALEALAALP